MDNMFPKENKGYFRTIKILEIMTLTIKHISS